MKVVLTLIIFAITLVTYSQPPGTSTSDGGGSPRGDGPRGRPDGAPGNTGGKPDTDNPKPKPASASPAPSPAKTGKNFVSEGSKITKDALQEINKWGFSIDVFNTPFSAINWSVVTQQFNNLPVLNKTYVKRLVSDAYRDVDLANLPEDLNFWKEFDNRTNRALSTSQKPTSAISNATVKVINERKVIKGVRIFPDFWLTSFKGGEHLVNIDVFFYDGSGKPLKMSKDYVRSYDAKITTLAGKNHIDHNFTQLNIFVPERYFSISKGRRKIGVKLKISVNNVWHSTAKTYFIYNK